MIATGRMDHRDIHAVVSRKDQHLLLIFELGVADSFGGVAQGEFAVTLVAASLPVGDLFEEDKLASGGALGDLLAVDYREDGRLQPLVMRESRRSDPQIHAHGSMIVRGDPLIERIVAED